MGASGNNKIADSLKRKPGLLKGEKIKPIINSTPENVSEIINYTEVEIVSDDEVIDIPSLSKELVIRKTAGIPDEYLLSFVVKKLIKSNYDFQNFWKEVSIFTMSQLKNFGGNILDENDKNRALGRVLKLINLGLEIAVSTKPENEKILWAELIFTKKPIELIYKAGKMRFMGDKEVILDIMKDSEMEVYGFWFRLISLQEISSLQKLTDLDKIKGTYAEYAKELNVLQKIQSKLMLVPFLSLKQGLSELKHWGSMKRGSYSTEFGVIDNFLLSLIIACLFRGEENFSSRREILFAKELIQYNIEKINAEKESLSQKFPGKGITSSSYLKELNQSLTNSHESLSNLYRGLEEDKKFREFQGGDFTAQRNFLLDILKIKIDEIKDFADLLFYDPLNFATKVDNIENIFVKYFFVASKTLNIKAPMNFYKIIKDVLEYTAKNITEEIKKFYNTTTGKDVSNLEILKFWDQRLILDIKAESLKMPGINAEKLRSEIITQNLIEKGINVEKIFGMPTIQIIDITKNFSLWKKEDKESFCKKFNPNLIVLKEGFPTGLLKILKNISNSSVSGWGTDILNIKDTIDKNEYSETINTETKKTPDWVEIILNNFAWANTDAFIISEMWKSGSDQIRDIIFNKKDYIKISVPSLKNQYLFEHKDLRLLNYILDRLINEDKLKPSSKTVWEDLISIAKNGLRVGGKAVELIQMKYDNIQKKK